jgi:uncharacterized protein YqhQ
LPGLYLQKLTTRQPSDAQVEVAIKALAAVLPAPLSTDGEAGATAVSQAENTQAEN